MGKRVKWREDDDTPLEFNAILQHTDGSPYESWIGVQGHSTDIAAAWEVVESARNDFSHPFLMSVEMRASCYVVLARWVDETGETTWVNASADTAPLAICRAALLAVMEASC
jgi:hypothetical protein